MVFQKCSQLARRERRGGSPPAGQVDEGLPRLLAMSTNSKLDERALQRGRAVCPKCGKKGVGYAPHPHAFGYKDRDRAVCRYCNARFVKPGAKPLLSS